MKEKRNYEKFTPSCGATLKKTLLQFDQRKEKKNWNENLSLELKRNMLGLFSGDSSQSNKLLWIQSHFF